MPETQPLVDESYWNNFSVQSADLDFLSNHLLEIETPLGPVELAVHLIAERVRRAREDLKRQRTEGGRAYLPKEKYKAEEHLVFPALNWQSGVVQAVRPAKTLNGQGYEVIEVQLQDGSTHQFAAGLAEHALNDPPKEEEGDTRVDPNAVMQAHGEDIVKQLEAALRENDDFVYIAGRWFPKALIVDVGEGQLNVAEALLDMAGGGPLPTDQLLGEVELPQGINLKLANFSLDLALQNDARFDEVGPAGEVGWFLHRLEPEQVRQTPVYLRYSPIEHDRTKLTPDMLDLERRLDDELSPIQAQDAEVDKVEVRLIYPHWRAGTFPLTDTMTRLFPTAYESPRVRFNFVDGETGERFPGWVVRLERYVFGLGDWYQQKGLMPGGYVRARRGDKPGEIIVETDSHRSSKEWVRTALIGADGGVVYAMLKQTVETSFDERMMVYMPSETEALDAAWARGKPPALAGVVTEVLAELTKLNPQNHVHATELYSAVNVIMRCPPAPILALLASHSEFQHVGDLHYRLLETSAE